MLGELGQQARERRGRGAVVLALAGALALSTGGAPAAATSGREPGSTGAEACVGANLTPSASNTATVDTATLCLVDGIRQAHHLRALHFNGVLQLVANSQVRAMVSLDYFADMRPSGITPAALIARSAYGRHANGLITAEN
ncbi:MAG TPA: hypothetical protein VMG62_07430, partial [Solirubrobacteraceae bacterium]|nr:hypothetical protein [Solirubrobacteraceae bacterium]